MTPSCQDNFSGRDLNSPMMDEVSFRTFDTNDTVVSRLNDAPPRFVLNSTMFAPMRLGLGPMRPGNPFEASQISAISFNGDVNSTTRFASNMSMQSNLTQNQMHLTEMTIDQSQAPNERMNANIYDPNDTDWWLVSLSIDLKLEKQISGTIYQPILTVNEA